MPRLAEGTVTVQEFDGEYFDFFLVHFVFLHQDFEFNSNGSPEKTARKIRRRGFGDKSLFQEKIPLMKDAVHQRPYRRRGRGGQ